MKSKILFQLFLFSSLGIIYLTMSSKDDGYVNTSGTSCGGGGCHGTALSTETTVAFPGAPTTATTGQVLNLQFTMAHATNVKYGYNIFASGGTLAVVSAGSKLSGGQLTHQSVLTNGTVDFKWTAPTTPGTYTLKGVGNAVNGDGSENAADKWNNTSINIVVSFPASVNNVDLTTLKCYPNPTTNNITIDGLTSSAKNIRVHNIYGQQMAVTSSFNANTLVVNSNTLSAGMYFLSAQLDGKTFGASFVKK
jgi:hypothetical protein